MAESIIKPYPEFFDPAAAEQAYAKFFDANKNPGSGYEVGLVVPAMFLVRNKKGYRRGDPTGKGGQFNCGMLIIGEKNFRCVRTITEAVMTAKMRGIEGVWVIQEDAIIEDLIDLVYLPHPEEEPENESAGTVHSEGIHEVREDL